MGKNRKISFNGRKLARNEHMDRKFMFMKIFWAQWVVCPCPGAVYMYMTGIYLEFLLDGPLAHPTKIPWALTLAGSLGAARLPVGSRGNALVRGQGERSLEPKLDLSILHVPGQPLLRPFFLVFYFYISTVLVYSRNIF